MTAMPWGQKKRRSEMIQSQTVTPPFAAMEGTTLRLKTATTKRRTRSQRPRTRFRWGVSAASGEENVVACVDKKQIPRFARNDRPGIYKNVALHVTAGGRPRPSPLP